MSAKKVNKVVQEVIIYVAFTLILLLTLINLDVHSRLKNENVLGVSTQKNGKENFWEELLTRHPNYIPGWAELGRTDKIKEINPNYF